MGTMKAAATVKRIGPQFVCGRKRWVYVVVSAAGKQVGASTISRKLASERAAAINAKADARPAPRPCTGVDCEGCDYDPNEIPNHGARS